MNILRAILLSTVIVLLANGLPACSSNPPVNIPVANNLGELIIWPAPGQSSVNLVGFPQQAGVKFSVRYRDRFVPAINHDHLRLYEDGHEVKITQVAPIINPITFVFAFDIGGPGAGMITLELFEKLLEQTYKAGAPTDRWIFCSTKMMQVCNAPIEPGLDDSKIAELYQQLRSTPEDPIQADLSVILRRAIAFRDGMPAQKVIIVVKQRTNATIPYITDSLVTDLLIKEIPIALVNFTESNDEPAFRIDAQARLGELNGYYLHGDPSWADGLERAVEENRRTDFLLSYESHLFRDDSPHEILLGYEAGSWEAWEQGEFHFLPTAQGPDSSLRTPIQYLNYLLLCVLPLIILAGMVVVKHDAQPFTHN